MCFSSFSHWKITPNQSCAGGVDGLGAPGRVLCVHRCPDWDHAQMLLFPLSFYAWHWFGKSIFPYSILGWIYYFSSRLSRVFVTVPLLACPSLPASDYAIKAIISFSAISSYLKRPCTKKMPMTSWWPHLPWMVECGPRRHCPWINPNTDWRVKWMLRLYTELAEPEPGFLLLSPLFFLPGTSPRSADKTQSQ